MRIKINQIDFEVSPVSGSQRAAILSDPMMARAILRDVWEWDHAGNAGKLLAPSGAKNAVILPNGLCFHVAPIGADGQPAKNEAASRTMAERTLKATGAKTLNDLLAALNRMVELPQKLVPFEVFQPLNAVTPYRIRMFTDYAVLRLQNPGRNLTAYLCLPSQVGFHADLGSNPKTAEIEAAGVDVNKMRPGYIVPARAPAAQGMRQAALAQLMTELQSEMDAGGGRDKATDLHKLRAARLGAEWKIIAPQAQQKPQQASQPLQA